MEKPTSLSATGYKRYSAHGPSSSFSFWPFSPDYTGYTKRNTCTSTTRLPSVLLTTCRGGERRRSRPDISLRERSYANNVTSTTAGDWKVCGTDLAALHHDNRDGSHASLYYMALRCALTGVDTPSTDMLIRRSCGLNLVFFGLSFLSMTLLLHMLFPGKTMLTTFCLLLAYMNPVSVSNVLQAREYLMAEWLFVLWAYWCLRAAARIHNQQTLWAPGTFTGGLAISAALLSCGYFNALFFGFTLLCLAVYSCRQHAYKDLAFTRFWA